MHDWQTAEPDSERVLPSSAVCPTRLPCPITAHRHCPPTSASRPSPPSSHLPPARLAAPHTSLSRERSTDLGKAPSLPAFLRALTRPGIPPSPSDTRGTPAHTTNARQHPVQSPRDSFIPPIAPRPTRTPVQVILLGRCMGTRPPPLAGCAHAILATLCLFYLHPFSLLSLADTGLLLHPLQTCIQSLLLSTASHHPRPDLQIPLLFPSLTQPSNVPHSLSAPFAFGPSLQPTIARPSPLRILKASHPCFPPAVRTVI